MRIALIHVADKGGGAERSVLTLHKSLLKHGHDSRLFVGSRQLDEPGVIEIERRRSIPGILRITSRLEQQGIQNLYAPWFRKLPELIGDADVVHMHSLWKSRNGFADLTGIRTISRQYPTVMTLRDGWMLTGHCACPIGCDRWKIGCGSCPDLTRPPAIEKDYSHRNWNRKRSAIQKSNLRVTAVSTWLKSEIEESPIFEGKQVDVVHNSVDETEFQPGDRLAARAALNIPNDRFVMLLAGQSIEGFHQGISQQAVQALNKLNDSTIHAMLVGRAAPQVAETLKTPSSVVPFRHTPADMAQCYQAADLTIVPSEYETFGRVAAESLFCGTPVLAFATGGLTDIVVEDVCGRLVPTGDVDAMASALDELKSNPDQLQRLRSSCAAHVRERFNTDRIAEQYMNVYEQVIADRRMTSVSNARPSPPSGDSRIDKSGGQPHQITDTLVRDTSVPQISCIVPAWNCGEWLKRAVDSLIATSYIPLEVLIIDDGSTDNTFEVATQLSEANPGTVHVLQHPGGKNYGVSASRNLGLRECKGEWISFLDADDYVYPHRYESAAQILSQQPDVDAVHQLAEMVFPTEESSQRWWNESPWFGFTEPIEPDDLLEQLLTGKCWATSAIVFRRSLLERSGSFHEQLKVAEDCHLWFRMAAIGRIVSGDLSQPVSAYWRRLDSAYQPSPSQRLQMISAMTSFLAWLRRAPVSKAVQKTAQDAVSRYVMKGLVNARFDKQRRLAWSIAWQGLRGVPSLSIDPKFCGQLARLAAGR